MHEVAQRTPGPPAVAGRVGLNIAGLALIMVLPVLDQTIVATALPSIGADLGGLGQIAWVVNAYLLGVGLSAPLYGKLGDLYGRKPLLITAVCVFVAASALAGASRSMGQLIACRAVQGLGGGGLMSLTTAAVADLLPPTERGRAQGYTGAVFAAGSIGGPLLGGVFCGTIGWRWVFYINVPLALAGLVIVLRWFRVPSRRVRQRLDWPGGVLLAGAVTCALLVTDWGGVTYPWGSGVIVSLIAASAAAAAAFVWRETRAADPVLPPGLWRGSVFRVAMPSSFLLGVGLFGTVVFLPQFFQVVQGRSAAVSGALLAPTMLAAVVAGVYSATRMASTGRYRQYPIIGSLLLIAGFLPLTSLSPATPTWQILAATVALGLGVGFQMQLMVIIVQNAVPHRDVGTATAATLLFRSLGGAAGTALFSTLMLRRFSARLAIMMPGHAVGNLATKLYQGIVSGIIPLSGGTRAMIVSAFGQSVSVVYLWAIPVAAALLILALLLPTVPVRTRIEEEEA
jgi:EmrB/QacA subfamily drug resistance transporter